MQLLIPRVIKSAVDAFTQNLSEPAHRYFLHIAFLAVLVVLLRFGWRFFLFGTARKVERDLRALLHHHFLHLPLKFHHRHRVGDLMARLSNDLMAITEMVGFSLLALVDAVVWSTATIAMMLWIHIPLTLVLLIPLPFLGIFSGFFGREIHRKFQKVQEQFSRLTEEVEQMYTGIRVLQAYCQEEGCHKHLNEPATEYLKFHLSLGKVSSIYQPGLIGFSALSTVLLIALGGRMAIFEQVTLGDFAALSAYLSMLIWPVMAFGWMVNIYQRGQVSWKRIQALLMEEEEPVIAGGAYPEISPDTAPAISFSHLTFCYAQDVPPVLQDIHLQIHQGEWMGIVGRVGSGKSTLFALLNGLYPAPKNSIFIQGIPIEQIPLSQLRNKVVLVAQEPIIFTATVQENLTMGRAISEKEMVRACQASAIHEEILRLPEGYQTRVGERGFTLSGGQRQRLALARALLSHSSAKIFLLDDCLSQVDVETEQEIRKAIKYWWEDKTVLWVTHRPSILSTLERIIVLESGRIVEMGSHRELMAKEGFYSHWIHIQQLPEVNYAPALGA